MIIDKDIKVIELESISNNFYDYYGYKIPLHPMKNLIGKMQSNELIKKSDIKLCPNFRKMKDLISNDKTEPVDFSFLINDIKRYVEEKFKRTIDLSEIENGLLKYLNDYQCEILNSIISDKKLINAESKKDISYMINDYVFYHIDTKLEFKKIFTDLIIANINLTSIFYNRSSSFKLKSKCIIFLDTRIIFRLLGIEGEYRKQEYKFFIQDLLSKNYELCIFEKHYEEIMSNLDECRKKFENDKFNSKFVSPVFRYFIENNYTISEVIAFEGNVDDCLAKYKIKKVDFDYKNTDNNVYNIDEEKFYSLIAQEYQFHDVAFNEANKKEIIWNDVKAISTVYRLRRGKIAYKLSDVKYVFLTVNSALVRANRAFVGDNQFYKFTECLSDSFFCTYLWLATNNESSFLIKKRLLSASYDYIKINASVKNEFLTLLTKKEINYTEEQICFLRESEISDSLLSELTYNETDNISDELPEIILNRFTETIEANITQKKENEISNLTEQIKRIEEDKKIALKQKEDSDEKLFTLTKKFEKDARNFAKKMMFFITFVFICISVLSIIIEKSFLGKVIALLAFLISLFFTFSGFSLKALRNYIFETKFNQLKLKYGVEDSKMDNANNNKKIKGECI